ncbi:unnamed protein product [Caretta caretta]
MYVFLSHLSLVDVCFTSTTMPKLLANLRARPQGIPYTGCLVQVYLFVAFATPENFLLAVMAWDRSLALCRPLRYAVLLSPLRRRALVGTAWLPAHLHSLLMPRLSARISSATSSPWWPWPAPRSGSTSHSASWSGGVLLIRPFLLIVLSYARILRAVLRVPGRHGKACGAHLAAVGLFYGIAIGVYFPPLSSYSGDGDKLASVTYTVVTPTLNPFIYCLRNQDIKAALRQGLDRLRGAWWGWGRGSGEVRPKGNGGGLGLG